MNKTLLVGLLCLNAVLVVALVARTGPAPAYGQFAGANYLVVTGKAGGNDAVYVLDLASRRLTAWRAQRANKDIRLLKAANRRELLRDFGRSR